MATPSRSSGTTNRRAVPMLAVAAGSRETRRVPSRHRRRRRGWSAASRMARPARDSDVDGRVLGASLELPTTSCGATTPPPRDSTLAVDRQTIARRRHRRAARRSRRSRRARAAGRSARTRSPEDFGGGGLLLQRLGQARAVALLQLREQPGVLDGDDCLIRERLEQAICPSVNGRARSGRRRARRSPLATQQRRRELRPDPPSQTPGVSPEIGPTAAATSGTCTTAGRSGLARQINHD